MQSATVASVGRYIDVVHKYSSLHLLAPSLCPLWLQRRRARQKRGTYADVASALDFPFLETETGTTCAVPVGQPCFCNTTHHATHTASLTALREACIYLRAIHHSHPHAAHACCGRVPDPIPADRGTGTGTVMGRGPSLSTCHVCTCKFTGDERFHQQTCT